MTNMPRFDLSHPSVRFRPLGADPRGGHRLPPRPVPVTEEACEQLCCPCFKRGFAAGVRAERQRHEAAEVGITFAQRVCGWLCLALLVVLLTVWARGGE